jgi:hypothetical protein
MSKHSRASTVGVLFGLALFLIVALLPSLVYGGYAGLLLAGGIFGSPVTPTLLARSLVAFGMLLGVVSVASVFSVFGACIGALCGTVLELTERVEHVKGR